MLQTFSTLKCQILKILVCYYQSSACIHTYHQDLWGIYASENSFFGIFITHSLTNPMLCALALLWLLFSPLPLPLALLAPEPEEDSSLEDTEDISMVSICETMSSSRKGDLISSMARLGSSKSSSSFKLKKQIYHLEKYSKLK